MEDTHVPEQNLGIMSDDDYTEFVYVGMIITAFYESKDEYDRWISKTFSPDDLYTEDAKMLFEQCSEYVNKVREYLRDGVAPDPFTLGRAFWFARNGVVVDRTGSVVTFDQIGGASDNMVKHQKGYTAAAEEIGQAAIYTSGGIVYATVPK